jgi:hypothetical protein
MRRTQKPFVRRPSGQRCASWRSRPRSSRRAPCCFAPVIFWFASARLINALRGHLAEHGVVVPQGPANLKGLAEAIGSETTPLPLLVVELSRVFRDQIDGLSKTIAELEKATVQEATRGTTMRRLQTMPGVGPIMRDGD